VSGELGTCPAARLALTAARINAATTMEARTPDLATVFDDVFRK